MLVIIILGRSKKAAKLMLAFLKFLCRFKIFKKILGKKINKIGHSIENMQNVLVGRIVKQRELPILKMAKEILEGKN